MAAHVEIVLDVAPPSVTLHAASVTDGELRLQYTVRDDLSTAVLTRARIPGLTELTFDETTIIGQDVPTSGVVELTVQDEVLNTAVISLAYNASLIRRIATMARSIVGEILDRVLGSISGPTVPRPRPGRVG